MTTNYRPGVSPKDKNFFMSKSEEQEIKELTQVSSDIEDQTKTQKDIKQVCTSVKDQIKNVNLDELSEKDFQYIRGNMVSALETGQEAISDLIDLARSSGHPRAFEVLSLMLKTVMDGNKQLIDIHRDYKELSKQEEETAQTVNNNLFVGSTSELHKLLKQLKTEK